MNEQEFKKLKEQVEEAKDAASRAQGALDQLMQRLEDDFSCADLKEAKTRLKAMEAKRDAASEEFEKAQRAYIKKWKSNDDTRK